MTSSEDSQRDDGGSNPPEGQPEADLPDDVDAVFRSIVANFGDRATLDEPPATAPERPTVDPGLFDTSHLQPPEPAPRERAYEDEHFVPPDPPPIPRGTPARRLAWTGLFAPPLLMLLAVVFGWTFPDWASVLLVGGFLGGFVFLVATMPRDRGEDGDDGAVV